jgi:hypothetical protein
VRAWVLVAIAGCGRIDFDGRDASAPDASVPAIDCPARYTAIPGNPGLGTDPFCVMTYEAKAWKDADVDGEIDDIEIEAFGCDAACTPNWGATTHVPVSSPVGLPFRRMSQIQAQDKCRGIGADYDLISNPEWMTIARNAELVGENWSGGAAGIGRLVEGRTDGEPASYFGVTVPDDPYSDTGNSAADPPGAGWEQRRTIFLDTGDALWDFSANVQEWIDWTPGGILDGPPACNGGELPVVSCTGLAYDDFNSLAGTYDSTIGAGLVIGGSGTAGRRSGQNGDRPPGYAGIYALNMNRDQTDTFPGTGFRCVYRP